MAKTYLATRADISDMATNTNLSAHKNDKNNPHSVTATQLGAEVTSNRTDDIASNAEDSSRYPSTKGVADYVGGNYLPLTGGTLSGTLEINKGNWGQLSTHYGPNDTMVFKIQNSDSNGSNTATTWIQTSPDSPTVDNNQALLQINKSLNGKGEVRFYDVSDGDWSGGELFGEHNADEYNIVMKKGAIANINLNNIHHGGVYQCVGSGTGFPSGASAYGILTVFSTNSYVMQIYSDSSNQKTWIRSADDVYIAQGSAWRELGEVVSGSYTGTGGERTVSIPRGVEGTIRICDVNNDTVMFTTFDGTIYGNPSSTYCRYVGGVKYENGSLFIDSGGASVANVAGHAYYYQVL